MAGISPVKSNIEQAYRTIKKLMLKQKLIPGQRMLYRELSEQLGMSKTPIVNALNRLEQEGFVVSEPNVGYMVKPIDVKEIFDSYEVREALEIKALQKAIESKEMDRLVVLEEKCTSFEQYRPYLYDKKKMMLDCEFHLQIAAMSGNEVLKYLLRRNFEHMILRVQLNNYAPERMDVSATAHKNLLKWIKDRNFKESEALLKQHIRNARDYVIECISQQNQETTDHDSLFDF